MKDDGSEIGWVSFLAELLTGAAPAMQSVSSGPCVE